VARISFQRPTDQPRGTKRLLHELKANLISTYFDELRLIVGFAKLSPLLKLSEQIVAWRSGGRVVRAVLGVDQRGTSVQALQFALEHLTETYVAHVPSWAGDVTFHPKVYLFMGPTKAVAYIGSNNLTVGGTETNAETFTKLELELPADEVLYRDLTALWDDAVQAALRLNRRLLRRLIAADVLLDESVVQRRTRSRARDEDRTGGILPQFPALVTVPASPIPRSAIRGIAHGRRLPQRRRRTFTARGTTPTLGAEALVMQITPHRNGEVFLSKAAMDQDPAFFGWPFTGRTVPKMSTNPSYPQREPDPVVDLKVRDDTGSLILRYPALNLNTVFYARKSEIRVTVPPDVVRAVPSRPPYPIMVMRQASEPLDYDIEIHLPGSPEYDAYLQLCNQQMPSGGSRVARRFGWV